MRLVSVGRTLTIDQDLRLRTAWPGLTRQLREIEFRFLESAAGSAATDHGCGPVHEVGVTVRPTLLRGVL